MSLQAEPWRRWKREMSGLEIPVGRRRAASETGFPVSGYPTLETSADGCYLPAGLDGEF